MSLLQDCMSLAQQLSGAPKLRELLLEKGLLYNLSEGYYTPLEDPAGLFEQVLEVILQQSSLRALQIVAVNDIATLNR